LTRKNTRHRSHHHCQKSHQHCQQCNQSHHRSAHDHPHRPHCHCFLLQTNCPFYCFNSTSSTGANLKHLQVCRERIKQQLPPGLATKHTSLVRYTFCLLALAAGGEAHYTHYKCVPSSQISTHVGTDANARLLKDSLKECGADLSYLKELEGPSGTAMIMVNPSGTFQLPLFDLVVIGSTYTVLKG